MHAMCGHMTQTFDVISWSTNTLTHDMYNNKCDAYVRHYANKCKVHKLSERVTYTYYEWLQVGRLERSRVRRGILSLLKCISGSLACLYSQPMEPKQKLFFHPISISSTFTTVWP